MNCQKCGKPVENETVFCTNCGAKIERVNDEPKVVKEDFKPVTTTVKSSENNKGFIVLLVSSIILCIIDGILFLKPELFIFDSFIGFLKCLVLISDYIPFIGIIFFDFKKAKILIIIYPAYLWLSRLLFIAQGQLYLVNGLNYPIIYTMALLATVFFYFKKNKDK